MTAAIDLMRDYVLASDMCDSYNEEHGTDIKPWECVRYVRGDAVPNETFLLAAINVGCPLTFALAIIEGKPVFRGDDLYIKGADKPYLINWDYINVNWDEWTWEPPAKKRTFTLNGVELPCPVKDMNGCFLDFLGMDYYFESVADRNKVSSVIYNLLTAARDKE